MTIIESINRLLEDNIVPITKKEISKELYWEDNELSDFLLIETNSVRLNIKYVNYKGTQDPIVASVDVPNEYYYWSKTNFVEFLIQVTKEEIINAKSAIKLNSLYGALYNKVNKLMGLNKVNETFNMIPILTIEHPLNNTEDGDLYWEEFDQYALLEIFWNEKVFKTYNQSESMQVDDVLIDLLYSKKDQELRLVFKNAISGIINDTKTNEISFRELIFKLNSIDIEVPFKKPYTKEFVYSVLVDYSDYFKFNEQKIQLINDANSIQKILLKTLEFGASKKDTLSQSGIVSFVYNGNDFIFKPATEYVKLRKIVFITMVENVEKFLLDTKQLNQLELFLILQKLIGSDKETHDWISKNIEVGIYYEANKNLRTLYEKLIKYLSPVFNLTNNPGNLFATQFRELLESKEDGTKE